MYTFLPLTLICWSGNLHCMVLFGVSFFLLFSYKGMLDFCISAYVVIDHLSVETLHTSTRNIIIIIFIFLGGGLLVHCSLCKFPLYR